MLRRRLFRLVRPKISSSRNARRAARRLRFLWSGGWRPYAALAARFAYRLSDPTRPKIVLAIREDCRNDHYEANQLPQGSPPIRQAPVARRVGGIRTRRSRGIAPTSGGALRGPARPTGE